MSFDLAETVVGEFFMRRQSICVRWITNAGYKMRVRIARVRGYLLTLVTNGMHIMPVIVVGVVDMTAAGMRDGQDLANASRRRRTASVRGGMIVRVSNGTHIPIRIVAEMGTVSSKIGIVRQELLRGWIIGPWKPCWAYRFVGVPTKMQWCISEGASGHVAAVFSEARIEVRIGYDRRRRRGIDSGHARAICAAIEAVPFSDNRPVRAIDLILVANVPHRSLVTHILACPQQRVSLDRTGAGWVRMLRNVIILVSIISVRAVAVIDRGEAIYGGALSAVVLRLYRAVMVNDGVDLVSPTIVSIYLAQKEGPVVGKL